MIQLGEHPEHVFLVGGLGVDNIKRLNLLDRSELEASLGFKFGQKNLLITFHPETLENVSAVTQMQVILDVLANQKDTVLIFTMPNADTQSRALFEIINQFTTQHINAHAFSSLGQLRYLSCIAQVDAVLGNSSSGLTEVPTFKKVLLTLAIVSVDDFKLAL